MPVRLEADLDYELWEESLGREPTREEIALRNETIENNIAAFLASRTGENVKFICKQSLLSM